MKTILLRLQNVVFGSRRYGDIYIAFAIICILTLLVLPVPPAVLDTLIAVNLTVGIVLIMMGLYVTNILAFSTFPSLLLITTLFRLALNITSTRMILGDGYAGEIIYAFGSFVVAGNFVVGVVIFLILLIVQFIVITKGAERVAEVAARFTLDAMPGKQMSIDADMRAGVIDIKQAQRRRSDIERENQLFGAMDGAMKFVKGDAIASLIIVFINIVAGIGIGVMMRHMDFAAAIQNYSILTIGDGLVSQIPALLISITAGIIVTRVGTEEESGLGSDIVTQFFAVPRALLIGGAVLFCFALVPGFPFVQFIVLAAFVLTLGFVLQRQAKAAKGNLKKKGSTLTARQAPAQGEPESAGEDEDFSITVPILVDVDASIQQNLSPDSLNAELAQVRKALYFDLGVPFPGIHLRFNENLKDGAYEILLQEVPMTQGVLHPQSLYVREARDHLDALRLTCLEVKAPVDGRPAFWIPAEQRPQMLQMGIPFMESAKLLSYHISLILKRYAGEFLGLQETRALLTRMESEYPEIVREVQRVIPVQKICEVFQRLVQEEISIRNLRVILQSLIEWGAKEKDSVLLTEYVRVSLKRFVSYKFSGGRNVLVAYLLEPSVEELLRKSIRQTSAGSFLALDPESAKKLLDEIKRQMGAIDQASADRPPVILCSMDVRRYLRKLIELDLPNVPVLSHQELTEEINIQPLGRIALR